MNAEPIHNRSYGLRPENTLKMIRSHPSDKMTTEWVLKHMKNIIREVKVESDSASVTFLFRNVAD